MSLPNILTTLRFFLIPLFIMVFFSSSEDYLLYSSYIFIFAGFTDILDGYIARKYDLITKWGQVMDPLADKLMQITVLICLAIKEILPLWVIIVVGIKEVCMIIGGIFLYFKKEKVVIPANKYGKIATIIFYAAILSVTFGLPYGQWIVHIAIVVTTYAFIQYFFLALKTLKEYNMKKTIL